MKKKIFINEIKKIASFCFVKMLIVLLCVSCGKTAPSFETNQNLKEVESNLGAIINITPNELQHLLINDSKVLLVDIRRTEELTGKYKMIEHAIHIEDNFIFNNPNVLPNNRSIVIMCKTGHRSSKLSEFLKTQNRLVYNLKGGLKNYYKWRNGNIQNKTKDIPESKQDFINDGGC